MFPVESTTTNLVSPAVAPMPVTVNVLTVVLPFPSTENPVAPVPLSTSITLSVSAPEPCLKVTAPKLEFVRISGVEELS